MTEREKALEDALAQANGALADITVIVTSCVPQDADEKFKSVVSGVLHRILSSSSSVWNKPGRYIHDYEEELYEKYWNEEMGACASRKSSLSEAQKLQTFIWGGKSGERKDDFCSISFVE